MRRATIIGRLRARAGLVFDVEIDVVAAENREEILQRITATVPGEHQKIMREEFLTQYGWDLPPNQQLHFVATIQEGMQN